MPEAPVEELAAQQIVGDGLEIIWRDRGWWQLAGELMPGTIGAELQDLEKAA